MPFFQNYVNKLKRKLKNDSARSSNSIRHFLQYWKIHIQPCQCRTSNTLAWLRASPEIIQSWSCLREESTSSSVADTLFHGATTKAGQGHQEDEVCTAPQQTGALKNAGMQSIFAALRVPVNVTFSLRTT